MRVLIWGANPLSRQSAYWFWLKTGMEAAGHQVIALDALPLAGLFGVAGMQQVLLQAARAYRVQAALVLPQPFVEPWLIETLKAEGVAVISFRYDDCLAASAAFPPDQWRCITALDAHCHLSVTISRQVPSILEGLGLPVPVYLPMPYGWQAVPLVEAPLRPVIAFCGSPKQRREAEVSWRVLVARAIHQAGLPLELHHDEWQTIPDLAHLARPTPDLAGFFDVARSSAVNLSLSSDGTDRPYRGFKQLTLEIAAAGGPVIASPSDELADRFDVGRDIETAESADDFPQVARRLLLNPAGTREMGRRGRLRVEAWGWDAWWRRVAELLAEVGVRLDLDGPPIRPDRSDTVWPATALTAVAHAFERQGDRDRAEVYFQLVLSWQPDDYAANAGLARLAGSAEAALPFWRQACRSVEDTLPTYLRCPLGMPGVGADNTTHYRFEAAARWLATAMETRCFEGLEEPLAICARNDPNLASVVAEKLIDLGQGRLALLTFDLGMRYWPSAALEERRRQLAGVLGSG